MVYNPKKYLRFAKIFNCYIIHSNMKQLFILVSFLLFFFPHNSSAVTILIPMDDAQKDHLKSYGVVFWTLQNSIEAKWLLNYRGGS